MDKQITTMFEGNQKYRAKVRKLLFRLAQFDPELAEEDEETLMSTMVEAGGKFRTMFNEIIPAISDYGIDYVLELAEAVTSAQELVFSLPGFSEVEEKLRRKVTPIVTAEVNIKSSVKCPWCKGDVLETQKQGRSADEALITYYTCLKSGGEHKWKS